MYYRSWEKNILSNCEKSKTYIPFTVIYVHVKLSTFLNFKI